MSKKAKASSKGVEFVEEGRLNEIALAKVREGLAQAAEGELHDLGSFAKYADDEID